MFYLVSLSGIFMSSLAKFDQSICERRCSVFAIKMHGDRGRNDARIYCDGYPDEEDDDEEVNDQEVEFYSNTTSDR